MQHWSVGFGTGRRKNDLCLDVTVTLTESFIMKVMAGTDLRRLPDT